MQQRGHAQLLEHRVGLPLVERRQPQGDVAEDLHEDAAGPDDHDGAEHLVHLQAGDQLDDRLHLLGDQEAVDARVRPVRAHRRQHRRPGRAHLVRATQVEDDPAGL